MHLSQAQSQSGYSMKPLRKNSAAENGRTTPKSAFGKPISQCELSTKSLKPRGTYTPEKTSFQRVNRLLYQQTHRAGLQPKTDSRLPCSVSIKEQNNR
uniref:Uncharacterized protein n=1 Tax=Vibrio sp. DAT722 TaxID=344879 RepID=Q2F9V2_9VIBR|nr:hypothetical protein [Vibrio sp. DAT722]